MSSSIAQRSHILLLGAALMAALLTIWSVNSGSYLLPLIVVATGAIATLAWAVPYTIGHRDWLIFPLILTDFFIASGFLSDALRATMHYGLVVLFCLPVLFLVRRSGILWRGGFKLYTGYFVWAALTILYSLSPLFSSARLGDAVLMFGALTFIALGVNERDDLRRVLAHFLLACAVILVVLAVSLVVLPSSITYQAASLDESMGGSPIPRFVGIFSEPNEVGVVMLITVGASAAYWAFANRRQKFLLAAMIGLAMMLAALADSRTPFLALTAGATAYIVWRYRWRGVATLLLAGVLLVGLLTVAGRFGEYFSRGDVGTLTGRTDLWDFVIQQIKNNPITGYGYAVSGEIFNSRYFPIWWGPWDLGPHSSLHDGYLDHAIGVGVPATLLWGFIMARPWIAVFRRSDDPMRLKPIFFLMVIPMLVHNLTEDSIGDCIGAVGIVFGLLWAIAERHRMVRADQDIANQREALAKLPPALAALASGLILALGLAAHPPSAAAADSLTLPPATNGSSTHFYTLPPHAPLPSAAQCAALVSSDSFEPRPDNYSANHTVPPPSEVARFHAHPIKGTFAPLSAFTRIDGQFTGTTDQILRWSACKWGIDEDVVRAEAVVESHWHQDDLGDQTTDRSLCPAGTGFKGAWDGNTCWQSYGILQVKFSNWGGWPWTKDSTAFNSDCRWGYQRACMNGEIHYLGDTPPPPGYPQYPNGTPDEMLWGCMGDFYSGNWFDTGAVKYIAEVKKELATRAWARAGF